MSLKKKFFYNCFEVRMEWVKRPGTGIVYFSNEIDWKQSWALPVFFHFFNNKKLCICTFYQVNNLFLHQSYLKSPLPVKLT